MVRGRTTPRRVLKDTTKVRIATRREIVTSTQAPHKDNTRRVLLQLSAKAPLVTIIRQDSSSTTKTVRAAGTATSTLTVAQVPGADITRWVPPQPSVLQVRRKV